MFSKIYLEIIAACNLSCDFCVTPKRNDKLMSLAQIKKILPDLTAHTNDLALHVYGEPLLHPEFREIIEFITLQGDPQIHLTTNGRLLHKFPSTFFNNTNFKQINFSIQSFNKSDDLNATLEIVSQIVHSVDSPYLNLRLWNEEKLGSVGEENKRIVELICENLKIDFQLPSSSRFKGIHLINKLYLNFDTKFEWPSLSLPYQSEKGRCHGTVSQIGILSDGQVVPCCLDSNGVINLGNIFNDSLQNIVNGERFQNMKIGFENKVRVEKLCHHCSFANRFSS